jgi:ribulose-5-phosphate 4-epimerase/fuculose-1-phosphate aldolase
MNNSIKMQVSDEEWKARVDLAACYRIVAMYGWDDLVFTHISARVPGGEDHFLINPYGLLFEEITASSLVKVDLDGEKVLDSPYPVNPAGFVIHSAIHASREDAGCVLHTHTKAGIAVSAQEDGLLPISQTSLFPYVTLGYHNYEGVALNDDEKPRLVADLGMNNALILRNHGLLTTAPTVADAYVCAGNRLPDSDYGAVRGQRAGTGARACYCRHPGAGGASNKRSGRCSRLAGPVTQA